MVKEFPKELPSLPPKMKVDFKIDLVPGARAIFIPPYRIAPEELKELKE